MNGKEICMLTDIILLFYHCFYYHFAIHTKYTYKILKKDEARKPKEANNACVLTN